MTRTEYRSTRALIRANGYYALRWMPAPHAGVWSEMREIEQAEDMLAWRQRWIARSSHYESSANIIRLTSPLIGA